jgi:hypothetical protein
MGRLFLIRDSLLSLSGIHLLGPSTLTAHLEYDASPSLFHAGNKDHAATLAPWAGCRVIIQRVNMVIARCELNKFVPIVSLSPKLRGQVKGRNGLGES